MEKEPTGNEIPPDKVEKTEDQPQVFGLMENVKMQEIHSQLIEAMTSGKDEGTINELIGQYHDSAQEDVNKLPDETRWKAQIGLIISRAMIYKEAGRMDTFNQELEDAIDYAYGMGDNDMIAAIEALKVQ